MTIFFERKMMYNFVNILDLILFVLMIQYIVLTLLERFGFSSKSNENITIQAISVVVKLPLTGVCTGSDRYSKTTAVVLADLILTGALHALAPAAMQPFKKKISSMIAAVALGVFVALTVAVKAEPVSVTVGALVAVGAT
jgi:hypothetical protein